ncbi:hypothetical protein Goshw_014641 [Gossypium schwendimanii]|uniref:Uncharacterized protein n=1 Tax=Gossypium schwendimanii TaxID=34291 RepID=A0A7J9LFK7_GOSSC|nr:hypothetical protein [Gossypium schwendimanii]
MVDHKRWNTNLFLLFAFTVEGMVIWKTFATLEFLTLRLSSLVPVGFSGSGKGNKFKGRISKQNKILHVSNVRFKNANSQHVSLNKSMEQLAERISAISKDNFDSGNSTRDDEQNDGCWARQYELRIESSKRNNSSSNSANISDDTWVFFIHGWSCGQRFWICWYRRCS